MNSGVFNTFKAQLEQLNANLLRLIELQDENRRTLNRIDERLKAQVEPPKPAAASKPTPTRKTVTGSKST